jgi:hypothetical protein
MVPPMAHTRTLEEHELQDFTEEGQQIASSQYSTDAEQQHPGTNGESTKPASNTSHGFSNNRYNRSPRLERADEERPRNLSNTLRTCCAEMYKQIKCSCKSFFTVSWNTCVAFFPQCWKTLKPLVTICWDTCVAFFTQCWRILKPFVAICLPMCRKFGGKIKKVLKFLWDNSSLSALLSVVFGVVSWLGFPYVQWSARKDFFNYCRAEHVGLSPSIRK